MPAISNRAPVLGSLARPLVGRHDEIDAIEQALTTSRLVTLLGPAGTGKTRLAIEIAERASRSQLDEVWLVDLAPVRDPELLAQALLSSLDLREEPGRRAMETVAARLAGREALLVLDNCEHLVDSCAQLALDLLQAAPQVRVLATSRIPLSLVDETQWPVPTLSADEAVELFVQRARLVVPEFRPSQALRSQVGELCRRLDLLPLALELAAARMRELPVGEMLARLDQRFSLLSSRARDIPERHRTLRTALDWSLALLGDQDARLFARLSVFAGGFGIAAAEAVTGAGFENLGRLVDNSLLVPVHGAGDRARFRMLESLREYAADRLHEMAETDQIAGRHFVHFAEVAASAATELRGPEQVLWLDGLEEEHDNLRAALDWGQVHDPAAALSLAVAIVWFWNVHGHFTESVRRINHLLAAAPSADARLRAAGLAALGRQALNLPGTPGAKAALDESVETWRGLDEPGGLAHALMSRALLGILLREPAAACEALVREALSAAERAGDRHHIAESTAYLGVIAFRVLHDAAAARPPIVKAVELARADGNVWLLAFALDFLGAVELALGDPAAAWGHLTEASSLWGGLRDPDWMSTTSALLGKAALAMGDSRAAEGHLRSALRSRSALDPRDFALGDPLGIEPMAALAALEGRYERAVVLYGAAEGLPALALKDQGAIEEQPWYARALGALGKDRLRRALNDGRRMSQPEAIAYALAEPAAAPVLTRREREIAALVVQGMRNREIAERLFISERTVDGHLEHIKQKLGVSSRSEVAVWTSTHGAGG